jgi:hypothetical protein
MSHWNLKRAARLECLAGRGLSVESIMADHVIAARSERAVRCAATRDENQVAVCRQNHPETSALSL